MTLMTQFISAPVAEWLAQWPTTGGSAFERLQLALRRIPEAVQQLRDSVQLVMKRLPQQSVAASAPLAGS